MATAPFSWFLPGLVSLGNKEIDLDTDQLRLTLHTGATVPDRVTMRYFSALSGSELATGGGYTSGGVALSAVTWVDRPASTWATVRASTTSYPANTVVRPSTANGRIYRAIAAGTTGSSAPAFPTATGETVADGTVTWTCEGLGAAVLTASTVSWASPFSAGPFRYLVIRDATPVGAAAQPLVAVGDLGGDQTGTGGSFDITFGTTGIQMVTVD